MPSEPNSHLFQGDISRLRSPESLARLEVSRSVNLALERCDSGQPGFPALAALT